MYHNRSVQVNPSTWIRLRRRQGEADAVSLSLLGRRTPAGANKRVHSRSTCYNYTVNKEKVMENVVDIELIVIASFMVNVVITVVLTLILDGRMTRLESRLRNKYSDRVRINVSD